MNRREVTRAIGMAALGTAIRPAALFAQTAKPLDSSTPLPRTVAGVRFVDSKVANEATELARTSSPPYLFNHCVRTYLFGSLIGKASGNKLDEETFYIACILHDLGLTDSFMGDLPFEIQGAEAAKKFLLDHGMDSNRVATVWDGIAMHPLAIGEFKSPEIALVGAGAGADVLGADTNQVKESETVQILSAFPRLEFKKQFTKTCADAVRRHPRTASRTFMRDIAERNLSDYHPGNFCDAMEKAPYKE